jgi:hypothetical protein
MKKIVLFTLFAAASGFGLACNGDNSQNDGGSDSGPADTGNDVAKDSGGDGGMPQPPTLKTQIDRMGRPAINTALNHVFDPVSATKGAAKDTYNADKNVATWATSYAGEFKKNLAILDGLDHVCGNQAAFGLAGLPDYTALAGLTADDQLYVDTSKSTCTTYLAVELNATAIFANTDCGGRKMTYKPIWTTYTAAATGALDNSVTDGLSGPDATKTSGTTFPYLSAPQ